MDLNLQSVLKNLFKPFEYFSIMIISLVIFDSCIQQGQCKSLLVFPLQAPHLSTKQVNKQSSILSKQLARYTDLKVLSQSQVKRGMSRQRFKLQILKKPSRAEGEVKRLCIRLKTNYALSTLMRLGTDRKPAKLLGTVFFCKDSPPRMEHFELPFAGKLSSKVWQLYSEALEDALHRAPKRDFSTFSQDTSPSPYTNQRAQLPARPPSSNVNSRVPQYRVPLPMATPTPPPPTQMTTPLPEEQPTMVQAETVVSDVEASRFMLWGGGRILSKNLFYETKADSRSLRGGIRYETQWLNGWGVKTSFRPFTRTNGSAGRLAIFASFERYVYQSLRVVNSLFEDPETLELPSELNRWEGGFRYSYPLNTSTRSHQVGFSLGYHGTLMNIQKNSEFLGLDTHLAQLGLFGVFSVVPEHFYLELGGGFRPLASLGNRVSEFGATSENYGAAAWVGFRYRSSEGLSLGLMLHLDFLFSEPIGVGRDGRIGESAKDQTISLDLDLGFSSSPRPRRSLSPTPAMSY